jgi:hypothetical protein
MTPLRIMCLALALSLFALPLLAIGSSAADQGLPPWRVPADRAPLLLTQD